MQRKAIILATLASFLTLALAAMPVMAQKSAGKPGAPAGAPQITGELGSPSATTTVSNKQLPAPDPKFGGVIKNDALQSKPGGRPASCRPRARPMCC